MNTAKQVDAMVTQWKSQGISKPQLVVNTAKACIGWPYVFGERGSYCTPSMRRSVAKSHPEYPTIISKCKALSNTGGSCSGCKWHPGGEQTRAFDCRGFTYWLFRFVDITISGGGATKQYDTDANWSEKGTIDKMPKDKVCCVFRYENGKMQHTLLYDGAGNYIHCSGEVKTTPASKYAATHYAVPKGLYDGDQPVPTPEPETPIDTATVWASSGSTVRMRNAPSTAGSVIRTIQVGTKVDVLSNVNDKWTKISYGGQSGYMMTEFLRIGEEIRTYICHVPRLTKSEAEALANKYPGAWVSE